MKKWSEMKTGKKKYWHDQLEILENQNAVIDETLHRCQELIDRS